MIRRASLIGGCVAVALLTGRSAWADDTSSTPSTTDAKLAAMEQQMSQMQAQLQQTQSQLKQTQTQLQQTQTQLQQKAQAAGMTPQEEAALVQSVITDADKRSQMLLVGSANAGFDNDSGFYIQSDDGNTVIHPGILFEGQEFGHPDTHISPGSQGAVQGYVNGSLFSKDLTFDFVDNNSQLVDLPSGIEQAWVQDDFWHNAFMGHDLSLRTGRYKNPAFKESSIIGDPYSLLVSESLTGDLIGGGANGPEVNGGELLLTNDNSPWSAELSGDGGPVFGATTSDPLGDFLGTTAANISARFDYKFYGDWADTTDMTGHEWGHHDLLDVGGGIDYRDCQNGAIDLATLDAQYQAAQAWTLYGALYGQHIDYRHNPGFGMPGARNDWGVDVQGGYNITKAIQLIGRYSLTRADAKQADANYGESIFHELSIGMNYYFGPDGSWENHTKLTLEFDYLPNGTPVDNNAGYLASPAGHPERELRGQFQFFF